MESRSCRTVIASPSQANPVNVSMSSPSESESSYEDEPTSDGPDEKSHNEGKNSETDSTEQSEPEPEVRSRSVPEISTNECVGLTDSALWPCMTATYRNLLVTSGPCECDDLTSKTFLLDN